MKFEIERNLKNKIFTTSVVRVPVIDDACAEEEKNLEDDFGPVEIEVGGKYEAVVSKEQGLNETYHLKFTPILPSAEKSKETKANFSFSLPAQKVILKEKAKITYSCDATKECVKSCEDMIIDPLRAAEEKCKLFEAIVQDKIKTAVDTWKGQHTDFENEEVKGFEIPLC